MPRLSIPIGRLNFGVLHVLKHRPRGAREGEDDQVRVFEQDFILRSTDPVLSKEIISCFNTNGSESDPVWMVFCSCRNDFRPRPNFQYSRQGTVGVLGPQRCRLLKKALCFGLCRSRRRLKITPEVPSAMLRR